MNKLVAFASAALILASLAACGDKQVPASAAGVAPPSGTPAQAAKPFVFGEYAAGWHGGGTCSDYTGGAILAATPFTLDRSVTVTAIHPVSDHGLQYDVPTFAKTPARIAGHANTVGGGTFVGTQVTQVADLRDDTVAALGWKARRPIVGAALARGRYFLFQPVWVSAAGGAVDSWRIDWTAPDGSTGSSVWRDPRAFAQHCP